MQANEGIEATKFFLKIECVSDKNNRLMRLLFSAENKNII